MANPHPVPHPENLNRNGRKAGTKNLAPRSVKTILREFVDKREEQIYQALERGIAARPPASLGYISLCAQYLDTKPAEQMEHSGSVVYHVNLGEMFSSNATAAPTRGKG